MRRFCFDEFSRQYTQTIGADFYIKRLLLPGKHEITIRISDLSGGVDLKGPMVKNYLFKANVRSLNHIYYNSTVICFRWSYLSTTLQTRQVLKTCLFGLEQFLKLLVTQSLVPFSATKVIIIINYTYLYITNK